MYPVSEIIAKMCHPDRTLSDSERATRAEEESKGEWRDLLFVWVSNHATRRDYVANFREKALAYACTRKAIVQKPGPPELKSPGLNRQDQVLYFEDFTQLIP
jgi:hypothetical protein